jgi:hypothetical protein
MAAWARLGNATLPRNLSPDVMLYLYAFARIGGNTTGNREQMLAGGVKTGVIDRIGITVSGLCVVHCIASAVGVAMLASAGSILLDPIFHEVGLVIALILGVVGLGRGLFEHGFMMPAAIGSLGLGMMAGALSLGHGGGGTVYAVAGVLILALGHDLNRRAVI